MFQLLFNNDMANGHVDLIIVWRGLLRNNLNAYNIQLWENFIINNQI